jgi:hypothetical protein
MRPRLRRPFRGVCTPTGPLSRRWVPLEASARRLQAADHARCQIPENHRQRGSRNGAGSGTTRRHSASSARKLRGGHAYWKCWPCLFPQHGAGPKHLRTIELRPWQQQIADRWPEDLLGGLIHSDGCRFINTGRKWICPRYSFSNASEDIRQIYCRACDLLGLRHSFAGRNVYVSRKADVAKLDTFIGPKQ